MRHLSEKMKVKKKMIEALLFATNEGFTLEEIEKRTSLDKDTVLKILKEMKKENQERESAIEVLEENEKWRMKIKGEVAPIVSDLLPYEIPGQILKTLAIIAYKNPANQSEIIKIRGNKAYNHIKELREGDYITTTKKGRSNVIRLAPKFFKYFDLSKKEVKEMLKINEENIHKGQNTKDIQEKESEGLKTEEKDSPKESV